MSDRISGCWCVGWLCGLAVLAVGQARAQLITHLDPAGVPAGVEVEVTVHGARLGGPTQVLLPGGTVRDLRADPDGREVRLRVFFPEGTGPRLVGLRLATEHGISNLKPLVVDDLPVISEREPNDTPRTAQPIPLNVALAARADAGRRDYYRLRVKSGQYLVVEVVGRRLDTGIDPQIRILDATGKHVLASSDDTPGLWQDCRVRHVFAKNGDYLIEVSDVRLHGGESATYWLRVGELPDVSFTLPMAVPRGRSASVLLIGPPFARRVLSVRAPGRPDRRAAFVAIPSRRSPFHGFVPVLVDDLTERLEREPNDTPDQADRIPVGCAVNGLIDSRGDQDCYLFRLTRGSRVRVETTSRWLDSPADVTVAIRDLTGRELAFNDDAGLDDARVDFAAPRTGWYVLVVGALSYRLSVPAPYRVRVVPYGPDFTLKLERDSKGAGPVTRLAVPRGGTTRCRLRIERRAYEGPIELRPVGLPAFVRVEPLRIAPGTRHAMITFTADDDAPLGAVSFQLVGYGIVHGRVVRRYVDCSAAVAEELGMHFAPPPLDSGLALAVTRRCPIDVRPATRRLVLQRQQEATLNVELSAARQLSEPVTVELRGSEEWVDCPAVTADRAGGRVLLRLVARPVARQVETTAVVVARTNIDGRPVEASSRVIRIVLRPGPEER